MMEFKDRLIQLRKEKKLYQVDLAKKLGLARATYAAYEQGTRQPDFDTLEKLSDFFECTVDFLLGRTDVKDNSIIRGQEEDISTLTDYQKTILDWAQSQESLSLVENKEELSKILDDIAFIFEYERRKKDNN